MFENVINFFKNIGKKEEKKQSQESSKDAAKERLHLVLMQDRANVSADFLELMKQEIIDVIKKYIEVDENEIDVRLTNKENEDGTNGAPALYANIPILNIKNDARKIDKKEEKDDKQNKEDEAKNEEKEIMEKAESIVKNEEDIQEVSDEGIEHDEINNEESEENVQNDETPKEEFVKEKVKSEN